MRGKREMTCIFARLLRVLPDFRQKTCTSSACLLTIRASPGPRYGLARCGLLQFKGRQPLLHCGNRQEQVNRRTLRYEGQGGRKPGDMPPIRPQDKIRIDSPSDNNRSRVPGN